MFLNKLCIYNYRSCKAVQLDFEKDEPNIFIGINDCGKTTILKAIGLLLEDKGGYYFVKENSSKKDFSNSPLSTEDFASKLGELKLPILPYSGRETIILGRFIVEDQDIDVDNIDTYSSQILWTIENLKNSELWIAKIFDSANLNSKTYLLTNDVIDGNGKLSLWGNGVRELDKKIKELEISAEDIQNSNGKGRFTNLEKVRAIYSKLKPEEIWSEYKIDKGDKNIFPTFRYLDWNSSLDDIKKTATDAMAATIDAQLKPLRQSAFDAARITEEEINKQLLGLQSSIAEILPNVTAIKTKVFFEVKESVTDILINKVKSDGDIHLDLQGEGVKRQIWFALIKSGALASIASKIKNKKFIWAFDEPETHLYPSAQRQFFEIIKDVSLSNVETFICTHSTVFIDKAKLKNIKSVSVADDAYTVFSECDTVDEIFDSLELRNSDFLFYDRFLVIEGDTESHLIPELYKIYRGKSLEEDNVQLINLTGKSKWVEGKKALENVLAGFKKSLDYVTYLFDADMRRELGENALGDNFFFVGKQDIEDSIAAENWVQIVDKVTNETIKFTKEEVEQIVGTIPPNEDLPRNRKFYPQLERLAKQKLSATTGEQVTWDILPSKGNESAQAILAVINKKELIPKTIADAFDKLQISSPPIIAEVITEAINIETTSV